MNRLEKGGEREGDHTPKRRRRSDAALTGGEKEGNS